MIGDDVIEQLVLVKTLAYLSHFLAKDSDGVQRVYANFLAATAFLETSLIK